ncbi:MAG: transporter, family, multidrug resistance protein [Eubacteriaceae bacterium]|jgi:DHA1 family bicyclomycin/chloramphenicol resistance-like MFS transporter|nr:transporter, family, multidrug resistance protein [Eubacteriaceae bacterium]MDK2904980.1 transporter, family, multidrug resistance protein [Eubacteriaceae bacterium]MDK2935370.1 transporter, family, multidrug resistance protein [Eubacteriaceae bacterium]MDN5307364.1 transporter, family, multidrug resistance protein [Eubacteriaceae bacterium]
MNNNPTEDREISQPYLKHTGLVIFLALMNAFIPLSTDMYLPALPSMSAYFNSSSAITNLTLSSFFLFYAIGILFWGPLSDKFGRRRILLIGSIIYALSSIACALAINVTFLIGARIMQGIGAGGITSVAMAIIKDSYSGKKRESILAVCQAIAGLAPMLAPIIGSLLLHFADWRGSFWVLAIISLINLVFSLLFKETLQDEDRYSGSLFGAVGRLFVVAKNKAFIIPALIFSISSLPFMGYIAVSSYIYVDYFGLSAQTYSVFFAANALLSLAGPFIYVKFLSNMDKKWFATLTLSMATLSGIAVMTIGRSSPYLFWASFLLMSLSGTIVRPFSTNLLLNQQKGDTGSAASLIGTLFTVLGSVGMSLASLPWADTVLGLGLIIAGFSVFSLLAWNITVRSSLSIIGLENGPKS